MTRSFKATIQLKAKDLGIHKIGFTSAEIFHGLADRLKTQRGLGHHSGFEHPIIEERVDPKLTFPEAQSIISIGIAYPSKAKVRPRTSKDQPRGAFARASWGLDYHDILREKMEELIEYIESISADYGYPQSQFKAMVDTGELVDVAVAARAGLGFIGRNGLLISKEYGSYLYLGEIVTDIVFEEDSPVDYDCGDCYRCIDACPTQALLGDGRLNAQVCLSYQTQTKGYMPEKYRPKIGRVIYGCDICQVVCPYNKGMDVHDYPEMEPDPETTFPELKPLLSISNREFKERFSYMAGSWRGKKPLQRNAIIALANSRQISALPHLLKVIEDDPRPMIRGTAAWAVGKLASNQANDELVEFLIAAQNKESDPDTIREFQQAISFLQVKK